jgi:hypothetical protein
VLNNEKGTLVRTVHEGFASSVKPNDWEHGFVENFAFGVELLSEIQLVSCDNDIKELIITIFSIIKCDF